MKLSHTKQKRPQVTILKPKVRRNRTLLSRNELFNIISEAIARRMRGDYGGSFRSFVDNLAEVIFHKSREKR